jgi:hypothetical protein
MSNNKLHSNFKKVLLITAIPFFIAASCNKNDTRPCTNGGYAFAVTSEWNPQREIYNIGDTIFLNSSFSKSLLDLIGNFNVDYSNAKSIGGNITCFELDSVQHQVVGAVSKFIFVQTTGSVVDNPQLPLEKRNIFYQELNNSYNFKIGIIPKNKGLYAIFISNLNSQGIIGKNCTNADFANTLTNTNKNINLFQYAMNRLPASQFEIDRIYCFRVQ